MGPVEAPVVDVVDVGRGRQVWPVRVCAALVTVVFLAGIAGLAAVSPARSWTPVQQLARIRQFVATARTAHVTGTSTWNSGNTKGDLGTRIQHTSRVDGVISLPDRSHWTEDHGDGRSETIVTPEALFVREADKAGVLALEQWKQYPHPSNDVATPPLGVGPGAPSAGGGGAYMVVGEAAGALGALGAPTEVTDMLAHLTGLVRVDSRVIRGTVDVAALPNLPPDPGPLPKVTIELTSNATGRLERLVTTATGTSDEESYEEHTELRFTQWGAPVDVSPPTGNIDKTPDVEEEALSTFSAAPILVPGNLPSTYQLTEGSASEAGDAGDCAEADLTYGDSSVASSDPDAASASDINVTITPAACDKTPLEGDAATIGGHSGRIKRGDVSNDDYAVTVDMVIGATRMTVESDLPEAEVLAALRTIVPFDITKQKIAAPSSTTTS